jgi:hypothetical protein
MSGIRQPPQPNVRIRLKRNDDGNYNGALEVQHQGQWGIEKVIENGTVDEVRAASDYSEDRFGVTPTIEGNIPPDLLG